MVRASHRSSEGCELDPHLGLRNRFLGIGLDERSSIIQDNSKHFQNIYLKQGMVVLFQNVLWFFIFIFITSGDKTFALSSFLPGDVSMGCAKNFTLKYSYLLQISHYLRKSGTISGIYNL